MNADAVRHFYNYHLAENRKIWDSYIAPLSQEKFMQEVNYSLGSLRNHIVHLIEVDDAWFSGLKGLTKPENPFPEETTEKDELRRYWDKVEASMRDYLANLQDVMLIEKPFQYEEDKNLIVWQVLLHVVNHGTDHRAQILRILSDLGVRTDAQDYVFYVYENP